MSDPDLVCTPIYWTNKWYILKLICPMLFNIKPVKLNNGLRPGIYQNGIFITDQFGNFIAQYKIPNVWHIQIIDDLLVTISDEDIITIDLYATRSEKIKAPSAEYLKVLKFESVLVFFAEQRIDFYSLPR